MEKPIDLHSGDTIMIYIGLLNHAVVNSPFPIEIQDHNDPRIRISKKGHNAWEIQCYSKGFFNLVLLHKNEARKIVLKSIVVEDKQL